MPEGEESQLMRIPLDDIRVNPVALRGVNRENIDFRNLVESVKAKGVMSSVSVRPSPDPEVDGKHFILINGLQRFTASSEVGLPNIPATIMNVTEAEAFILQIMANAQTIATKPVEYAGGLLRILGTKPTMTEAELAGQVKMTPQWLSKMLGLNRLADSCKPLVNEGKISLANAFQLAKLPQDEQPNWLERAQTESPDTFVPAAADRGKEIKDALRKGNTPGEATFSPVMHLRNKSEIEAELKSPTIAETLIHETQILTDVKTHKAAAAAGFKLGIAWALNFDAKSIEEQKRKNDERVAKRKAESDQRAAEKKAAKDKEASAIAAQIRADQANLDPDVLLGKKKIADVEAELAEAVA